MSKAGLSWCLGTGGGLGEQGRLSWCLGTGGGLGAQGRFKLVFGDWRWSW